MLKTRRSVSPADLKELFSELPDVMVSLGDNEADRTFIYEDRVNAPMLKAYPEAAGPPRFRYGHCQPRPNRSKNLNNLPP